jgi:hypothetical protein
MRHAVSEEDELLMHAHASLKGLGKQEASAAPVVHSYNVKLPVIDTYSGRTEPMSDPFKQERPDALDEVDGKPREQTGDAEDGRVRRHGDVDQSESGAADPRPSDSDTTQAEAEQQRQLDTGEENPG